MDLPTRPRDSVERSKLIFDTAIGEVTNDKDQVLEHRHAEENPTGCAARRRGQPARR